MLILRVSPISYPPTKRKKAAVPWHSDLCNSSLQIWNSFTQARFWQIQRANLYYIITMKQPLSDVKQFRCSSLAIYPWKWSFSVRLLKHQWALHAHYVSCLKSRSWFFTLATLTIMGRFYTSWKVKVYHGCLSRKILVTRTACLCGRILRELAPYL